MTTWRENYRPGSFRGVQFYCTSSTRTGGRRTVLDEYPLRDQATMQDLGRKARSFNLSMTVRGAEYMAQRDNLIQALETAGPGTLIHPFYGELMVSVSGDYSIEESTAQGGKASITQTFVEVVEQVKVDARLLAWEANVRANRAQDEAKKEFGDDFGVLDWAGFVTDEAGSALTVALGKIGDVVDYASGAADKATSRIMGAGGLLSGAGQFSTLYNKITGSVQTLLLSPGNLGISIIGLVRSITSSMSPFDAFRAQVGLFNLGRSAKSVRSSGYVTPARAQQAANQEAIYTLIEAAAVAEAVRIATGRPVDENNQPLPGLEYDSREQAVAIRDQIVTELDRQALEASPARYQGLSQLTATLIADMNRNAASLLPLSHYSPQITMPALLIAHRLYGNARRADEIVSRNRLPHPGFVAGGQVLEVLKDA
ncbi:DNA circularization protein [Aquipseudomonas campi]